MFRKYYLPNLIYVEPVDYSILNSYSGIWVRSLSRLNNYHYDTGPSEVYAEAVFNSDYGKSIIDQNGTTRFTLLNQTRKGLSKKTHHIQYDY